MTEPSTAAPRLSWGNDDHHWTEEHQKRLYKLARIPSMVVINGIPRTLPRRYLFHPILAFGGWAQFRPGAPLGKQAFGLAPYLKNKFLDEPSRAVEHHLGCRERSPFEPWVLESGSVLAIKHHRALTFLILEFMHLLRDWSLEQLEAFMANPEARATIGTGRTGIRKITNSRTYEEGRAIISDLMGLTLQQPIYTVIRQRDGRMHNDTIDLKWNVHLVIEGSHEQFKTMVPATDGKSPEIIQIGYTRLMVVPNTTEIVLSKSLTPWAWSTAKAFKKKGIAPHALQETLDGHKSLILCQETLWDACCQDSWKVADLFTNPDRDDGWTRDIFGNPDVTQARESWSLAKTRMVKKQSTNLANLANLAEGEVEVLSDGLTEATASCRDHTPFPGVTDPLASTYEQVPIPSKAITPSKPILTSATCREDDGKTASRREKTASCRVNDLFLGVFEAIGSSCEQVPVPEIGITPIIATSALLCCRETGAEGQAETPICCVSEQVSVPPDDVTQAIAILELRGCRDEAENCILSEADCILSEKNCILSGTANEVKSTSSENLLDLQAESLCILSGTTSDNVPKINDLEGSISLHYRTSRTSKQYMDDPMEPTPKLTSQQGDLFACLPAVEEWKEKLEGLPGTHIEALIDHECLGSFQDGSDWERKCALEALCLLRQDGRPLMMPEAREMASKGVFTPRGVWVVAQGLNKRHARNKTQAACSWPHMIVRRFLTGSFYSKDGQTTNSFTEAVLGAMVNIAGAGWFIRPNLGEGGWSNASPDALRAKQECDRSGYNLMPPEGGLKARNLSGASVGTATRQNAVPTLAGLRSTEEGTALVRNLREALQDCFGNRAAYFEAEKQAETPEATLDTMLQANIAAAEEVTNRFQAIGKIRLLSGEDVDHRMTSHWKRVLDEIVAVERSVR